MSRRVVFQLTQASKRYGDAVALEVTDLSIEAGQATVLVGPSGCGKSTVVRLLAGLVRPDAGDVRFDGEPLSSDRLPGVRRRMGYVIQDGGLFPHLTGGENIRLMAEHLKWSREKITARVSELLELTRLPAGTLQQYPVQMSGGQRQRVSLIRAMMLDPEVLLLDEPLGALDPLIRFDLQNDLQAIFRRLAAKGQGKTVVLVTHDLSEAAFFADRIVLMRAGRIVQQGTIDDLLHRPAEAFVEQFIRAQRRPLDAAKAAGNQSESTAPPGDA